MRMVLLSISLAHMILNEKQLYQNIFIAVVY
jgi:hypothetical protein